MTRVRVDFSSRGPRGTVRGSLRRADAPFQLGEEVELFDPDEEDMSFAATVVSLDPDTGRALFDVHWTPVVDTVAARDAVFGVHAVARAAFALADVEVGPRPEAGIDRPERSDLTLAY